MWEHIMEEPNCQRVDAVQIAFKILLDGQKPPPGYQYLDCHMVSDVKLNGFQRKGCLVASGHMTSAPAIGTYAGAVSKKTVQVALTIAALNGLEVKGSNVENA